MQYHIYLELPKIRDARTMQTSGKRGCKQWFGYGPCSGQHSEADFYIRMLSAYSSNPFPIASNTPNARVMVILKASGMSLKRVRQEAGKSMSRPTAKSFVSPSDLLNSTHALLIKDHYVCPAR